MLRNARPLSSSPSSTSALPVAGFTSAPVSRITDGGRSWSTIFGGSDSELRLQSPLMFSTSTSDGGFKSTDWGGH